ncbi:hypothetical protein E2C01_058746 [Portunus trituberculatus]|uniref:3-hydroxyacyl-CoA dehydrogenase NAD binding domain-containing protein n=1 Tax=Portunus trituberculatus TaxID=210409 RepID=A0A5B7H6B4_PORTR|nr:hypothetical protein [Portunus trituberculatus]
MAFFTHLTRRSLAQSAAMANAIKNVTVIGSGLMGAGIAQMVSTTSFGIDNNTHILLRVHLI